MAIKKLRNGPVIQVDDAIIQWRQKMRREGIALGKSMAKAREFNNKQNKKKRDEKEIREGRKKFF